MVILLVGCASNQPPIWKMPTIGRGRASGPGIARTDRSAAPSLEGLNPEDNADSVAAESDGSPERGDLPDAAARAPYGGFWLADETRAWREAKRTNRLLLIDFSAEWCIPCMLLQTETFSDETVQNAIANDFVPLRIDVTEESRANREQLARYGIRGLPAVVLFDPKGRELDRIGQYLDTDAFLARLAAVRERIGGGEQVAAERKAP
jgi:thiol-disulfide isomerase/thioredoxin